MTSGPTTRTDYSSPPRATRESLRRIFTQPESETSTLGMIETAISRDIHAFLAKHVVAEELPTAELERRFSDTSIPERPVFVSEQSRFLLNEVVPHSVNVSHPAFVGHMTSALPPFMVSLSKIMTALNQNVVKIETSKAFTPLERQVIAMLHRLVFKRPEPEYAALVQRRDQALGVFASGGTAANITALWTARNLLFPAQGDFQGIREEGLAAALRHHDLEGLVILVSRLGHYSLSKAADLLGLGAKGLVKIETDALGRVCLRDLRQQLTRLSGQRRKVLSLVGIAGTTETGAIDPLEAMADLAQEFGTRLHVDAAWGGPALFSRQHAPKLRGIERADSVVIDAHKQLYVPLGSGFVLFKNPQDIRHIEHHARYIVREGSRDLGRFTLEGSRAGTAMLVHSGLRVFGREGYELLIDTSCELARRWATMIQDAPDFELTSSPELNILTYRYVPEQLFSRRHTREVNLFLNELTTALQKRQRERGASFVSRTTLEHLPHNVPTTVLRAVIANPLTSPEILGAILDEQRQLATELLNTDLRASFARLLPSITKEPTP